MSLTGDELTLNDKSYSIKDKNGNDFNLGKLLKRAKWCAPYEGGVHHTIIFLSLKIRQIKVHFLMV